MHCLCSAHFSEFCIALTKIAWNVVWRGAYTDDKHKTRKGMTNSIVHMSASALERSYVYMYVYVYHPHGGGGNCFRSLFIGHALLVEMKDDSC